MSLPPFPCRVIVTILAWLFIATTTNLAADDKKSAIPKGSEKAVASIGEAFPKAEISTTVDVKRQGIVDSWPADVDDSAARRDWAFDPRYDLARAFREYLIPTIQSQYSPARET